MDSGDIIRITTKAVPKGIVPDKFANLLFQREDGKWYAVECNKSRSAYPVDSSKIILLKK